MRTLRGLLGSLATATLLVGCSGSSAPPTDTLSTPTPAGTARAVMLSDDEARQVGIYVALLEQHLFIEPDLFDTAYVDPTPGKGGPALTASAQGAISTHFSGRMDVRWGIQPEADVEGTDLDYVTLPALPANRDVFQVSVLDMCGNLCAHSQRYRVTRHGDKWKATPVGAMAVS